MSGLILTAFLRCPHGAYYQTACDENMKTHMAHIRLAHVVFPLSSSPANPMWSVLPM